MNKVTLLKGDCFQKLKELEDNSVDSVVTDPPYGIGFMNKEWDSPKKHKELIEREQKRSEERYKEGKSPAKGGFTKGVQPGLPIGGAKEGKWFEEWSEQWAKEAYRVLKPGGYLVSFCAPRMYHRMASGIEDAGFEIRDQIMWVFGSGFPKSHNIGHKVDEYKGWGTALKPAHEPIVMARKPFKGNVANNVLEWGVGGINVDGCRIDTTDYLGGGTMGGIFGNGKEASKPEAGSIGRFPANIIFDEEAGKILDEQSGITSQGHWPKGKTKGFGEFGGGESTYEGVGPKDKEKGGASRFFYCPKSSKKDRNEGNIHPTVKPTDLMGYLIRLITPKGGLVLDPFMGSGSTGKAAIREGMSFIGIEREDEYMEIAKSRIEHEQKKNKHQDFFDI